MSTLHLVVVHPPTGTPIPYVEADLSSAVTHHKRVMDALAEVASPDSVKLYRLIEVSTDGEFYRWSGLRDKVGTPIHEGSLVVCRNGGSDIENGIFCAVEFNNGLFGTPVCDDFDPLSDLEDIKVVGHCEEFRDRCADDDEWEGNLGAVLKKSPAPLEPVP